jgi:hypothetical protein
MKRGVVGVTLAGINSARGNTSGQHLRRTGAVIQHGAGRLVGRSARMPFLCPRARVTEAATQIGLGRICDLVEADRLKASSTNGTWARKFDHAPD